jgi:acyl-coenzyme A synthetase/AMP-(fatty) acid ligase
LIEYLNEKVETQKKINSINNENWYKTGDKVHLEDNQLIFDGRLDRMVKRNGYRIELGEIEAVLNQEKSIKSFAVISVTQNESVKIIAFYTGQKSTTIELLNYCSTQLLKYMIPDKFVFLEEMPINSNGKIDYNHLITNFNDNE